MQSQLERLTGVGRRVLTPTAVRPHHPEPATIQDQLRKCTHLRKAPIGLLVGRPLELQRACLAELAVHVEGHIVEELPQHTVAEAIVVQVHL